MVLQQQLADQRGQARAAAVLRPAQLPAQLVVRSSTAPPARSGSGHAMPEREHAA